MSRQHSAGFTLWLTYCSSHSGQLSIGIVRWSDFDNISGNKVNAFKTTNDGAELAGSPATCLRSTSSRCDWVIMSGCSQLVVKQRELTSWVKCINVDAQIHRLGRANPLLDLLDDTVGTNLVNLSGLNNLEAAIAVVLVVGGSRQRRADAGVDV